MAVPVGAIVKTGLFVKKYWKEILIACMAILITPLLFIGAVLGTITQNSTSKSEFQMYKDRAEEADLTWYELVTLDIVNTQNDIKNKGDSVKVTYDFFDIQYIVRSRIKETDKNKKVTYKWIKTKDSTYTGYEQIRSFVRSLGCSDEMKEVKKIINFCEDYPQKNSTEDTHYEIKINKRTFSEVLYNYSDDDRQWILFLIESVRDMNGDTVEPTTGIIDTLNPDGANLSYVTLNPTKYPLGDITKLKGDVDINKIFAGRLAAVAEKYFKSTIDITSGYRSIQEQQVLWDAASPERRGTYVARPGHSRHQYGIAADVDGWMESLTNKDLEPFGLYKPMSYECWHIEPIETR